MDCVSRWACSRGVPRSYDGSEPSYGCRPVPSSWMDEEALRNLAAFILRAAQVAPTWGSNTSIDPGWRLSAPC
ncbi:hypothetical protein [Synechococcus sp. H65.1]|uniref:hypothetical protein n=1 Tax=unclassified Synechococcus TaxID=2626047 RepID=UPI0039C2107A